MSKKSKRIPFVPRWPNFEGHAVNVIKRYYPMLCAEHEFDDLLQEAYLVYMRCKATYPQVDNGAWFNVLFCTSLRNTLLKMAAKCGRTLSLDDPAVDVQEPGGGGDDAFMAVVLGELPAAVRQLINKVCFSPVAESREAYRKLQVHFPALT